MKGRAFFHWLGGARYRTHGLSAYYRAGIVNRTYHTWPAWAQQAYLTGADTERMLIFK